MTDCWLDNKKRSTDHNYIEDIAKGAYTIIIAEKLTTEFSRNMKMDYLKNTRECPHSICLGNH